MSERLDDLQNGYFIYQSDEGFRFGIDAVLLADFAAGSIRGRICDLGCGNGILPILLCARTNDAVFTGLEIQEASIALAEKSIAYNHLEERIRITKGDIREAVSIFDPASFDVVISNPPYMPKGHGRSKQNDALAIAREERLCTLGDVARAAAHLLPAKGRFFMVHRPGRLVEIFTVLRENRLEPKRLRMVHPFFDRAPTMVLVEAVKEAGAELRIEPPLVVYESEGVYTEEALRAYGATSFANTESKAEKEELPWRES